MNRLSGSGLQIPEINIAPYTSNAIFLNSFSTIATNLRNNLILDKKSLLIKANMLITNLDVVEEVYFV